MSNSINNYFSPAASTAATAKPNASSSTGSTTDVSGLNSVFLNLLTQELQNQDPTAPMDSTAMVGQMISLNQLNELYSINQTLTGSAKSSSAASAQTATQAANAALAAMASPAAGSMTSAFPSFTPATQTTAVNPYSFATQSHAASTMPLALR